MAHAIWTGAISFGLINIPIEVRDANARKRLSFHMLDSTDNSPIGYKKFNKSTGKEVSPKKIVKGYEYEKGQFVLVTPEDFRRANPKATQTIDIEDFVELSDVDLLMMEKPYYLVPAKNGQKGYVLLKKVLEETEKVAIAKFVMREKQHLVAIIARGEYLILELLRYAHEVKDLEDAKYLDPKELAKVKISAKELKMAEELVKGMTSPWEPEKYKDTYQDDLLSFINKKIKSGDVEEAAEIDEEAPSKNSKVVDLMPLLEKSLAASKAGRHVALKATTKSTLKSTVKRTTKSAQRAH